MSEAQASTRGSWVSRLALAGGVALAWGMAVERRMYTLRRVSAPVLEPGSTPMHVLHLSDLHMAPWQRDKQRWVRSLAELSPDLVVSTGDLLGHERAFESIAYALEPFAGTPGVFVHGSNDYFGPVPKNPLGYFAGPSRAAKKVTRLDTAELEATLTGLGWLDLNNAAATLTIDGVRLELFGVDDPHRGYDRLDLLTGAIDDLREDDDAASTSPIHTAQDVAPSPQQTLTVGVAHAPYRRVLNSFVNHGAEVIFAGHTHGGQIRVPGFGALVTNCDIPRVQARGLSVWTHALRSAYLNVSAGLGTSIYAPVRFACPPEATLLTLTPRA